MSKQEAERAAYQRVKTEKIIAVTAGLTIAAATAYVAYKQYDKRVDKIIKSGTLLQNMSNNSHKGVADAFYASMTKSDNTIYRGIYGDVLKNNGKVFETKISVGKNLKVASERNAVKALSELIKEDKDYSFDLYRQLTMVNGRFPISSQNKVIEKGLHSMAKGKVDSKVYDALNLTLATHNLPTSSAINKGFYDKLASKGYDAIMDVNDKKYSGFKSSKPLIVFNGAAKTFVSNIREVGNEEIAKDKIKGMRNIYMKTFTPSIAAFTAYYGMKKAASSSANNKTKGTSSGNLKK